MPEDLFKSESNSEARDDSEPAKPIIFDGEGRPLPQPHIKTSSTWDLVKRLVDLGSGLAVICTLIFIGLQWREMHTGGADTHALADSAKSQADYAKAAAESSKATADATKEIAEKSSAQAVATNKLAEQAKKSAVAAQAAVAVSRQSLQLSQEALRLQERPWIGTDGVSGAIGDDGKLVVRTTFTNFGKSPAFNITFHSAWTTRQPYVQLAYVFKDSDSRSVMMPGSRKQSGESKIELPVRDMGRLNQGLETVYFFGEITYFDVFTYQMSNSKPHVTHFCGYWDSKRKQFLDCIAYNDAD